MEKRTTLKDVAARAGVTTATVSYVLNKKKADFGGDLPSGIEGGRRIRIYSQFSSQKSG